MYEGDRYRGSAFRCTACDVNWPSNGDHRKCPTCSAETWELENTRPITAEECARLKERHIERLELYRQFEKDYEEREVKALRRELDEWLLSG